MKRDARIGLAVVLVLGLGVTLLVGRAIYKGGGSSLEVEGEFADAGTPGAPSSGNLMNVNAAGPHDSAGGIAQEFSTAQSQASSRAQQMAEIIDGHAGGTAMPPAQSAPVGSGDPAEMLGEIRRPSPEPAGPGNGLDASPPAQGAEYYAYTVVNGDSPWTVASKVYGDGKYTQKIVDANNLKTQKLKAGMVLKVPALPGTRFKIALQPYGEGRHNSSSQPVRPVPASAAGSSSSGGKSYRIESGDTLSGIAKRVYGSNGPKTIQMIVSANRGLDPAKLKVGQEISLPPMK